jgi:protoheme IX farnesyltransferase
MVTTAAGFWVGVPRFGRYDLLLPTLAGTALVVGAANALNQWMERVPDAAMQRTKHRPLPSGRLSPAQAKWFGVWLLMSGLAILAVAVNPLSAMLAAAAAASYLLVYTPLKRRTALCTLAGAIPGALPPMIGWAAARNALDVHAWALGAILFLWQLPHFLAIAVLCRDDYARARFQMLPVIESSGLGTACQATLYGLALVPVSLFPAWLGVSGSRYFYGAAVLSLAFLGVILRAAWLRSVPSCRGMFVASVVYLPALLVLLACDRMPV